MALSAADFERLRSWALDIAATLLPGVKTRDVGNERKWLGLGGFTVNRRTGAWYSFPDRRGSYSGIEHIKFLRKCSAADAEQWAVPYLDAHPGTGECTAAADDDDASPASHEDAVRILREAFNIEGTPAEEYLKRRWIEPPYPDGIMYWPHARTGEGAIVFILTSNARAVGVQVGYLDPDGNKSVVIPQRRRFMLEKAPGACFEIPSPGNGPIETVIACGLEDALAIQRWSRRSTAARQWRIIGLPGDGSLRHVHIDKGATVTVCRDADIDNPAADRAIAEGLDSLLLQAGHVPDWASTPAPASVFVTKTREHGKDANAILMDKGADGLTALLDDIVRADLSRPRGAIRWLAAIEDRVARDDEINRAAKALGIRAPVLRAEVDDWRKRAGAQGADEPEDDGLLDEEIDLAATLDGILLEMRRYIVAPDTLLGAATAWAAFTHLVHSERIRIPVAPRLGIQAKSHGCGKTLLLEVLNCLVCRPRASASITSASVLRMVGTVKPTMLLDEVHGLLRANDKSELLSLLNAGHYRWNSIVDRAVQVPSSGDWVVQQFSVWVTMALALIGDLPPEQQDRAISITLRKVLAKDVPDRLRHGTSEALKRRQAELATWAASIEELPDIEIPNVLRYQPGRVFDNWEPLLQIAELAGGRWPDLIRNAINDAVSGERALAPDERVLVGIRKAFDLAHVLDKKAVDRLPTRRLLSLMLGDDGEEWGVENRGRPINAYWLRKKLRGLLDPPGAQDWWAPEGVPRAQQQCESGYFRSQFKRSWETYTDEPVRSTYSSNDEDSEETHSSERTGSTTSDTSASSTTGGGNAGDFEGDFCGRSGVDAASATDFTDISVADQKASVIGHRIDSKKSVENQYPVVDAADEVDVADTERAKNNNSHAAASVQPERDSLGPGLDQPTRKTRAKRVKPKGAAKSSKPAKALNGAAQGQSRTDAVRAIREAHPTWDIKKVAEAMGQSVRNIGLAFKRAERPA